VFQLVGAEPVSKGSMKAFMPKRARFPIVVDTHASELKAYERDIRMIATAEMNARALPCAVEQPFEILAVFYLPRAGTHFGVGGLKATAPASPWHKPDFDKLVRAACDAFTGIVWDDDSRIVRAVIEKRFASPKRDVGLWIEVRVKPATMRELHEQQQTTLIAS
jgi:Holliday junction resolvase RusA-like endonuclease